MPPVIRVRHNLLTENREVMQRVIGEPWKPTQLPCEKRTSDYEGRVYSLNTIEGVDHVPEFAVITLVELETDSGQVHVLIVVALFRCRFRNSNLPRSNNVREIFV